MSHQFPFFIQRADFSRKNVAGDIISRVRHAWSIFDTLDNASFLLFIVVAFDGIKFPK
jgi:hypothetical protein